MAPKRRTPETAFKLQLGFPLHARWRTVLAPYVDIASASPAQLRSKARELALLTPAQLQQLKRDRQRQQRAERAERRSVAKEKREPITFTVTFEYEMFNPVHNRSYPTLVVSEPITDDPSNVSEYLTDDYFWRISKLHYSAEEQGRVTINQRYQSIDHSKMLINEGLPVEHRPMNRYVLRRGWLWHAIDENASAKTPCGCVPEGLSQLLLKPKGKSAQRRTSVYCPTEDGRVTSKPTSIETVKTALDQIKAAGDVRTRELEGYTSTHLGTFLRLQRINHYALDDDNSKFLSCSEFVNTKLQPVVWYTLHGHFNFVTSAKAIQSVSRVVGTAPPKAPKQAREETREVRLLEVGQLSEAIVDGSIRDWPEAIFVVETASLDDEWKQYLLAYREEAKANLRRDGQVSAFELRLGERKLTFQACSDYGTLPCETMRAICKDAGLAYNGLTSVAQVVRSLLNSVAKREYLTADEKERILERQDGCCAICEESLDDEKTVWDHIIALGNGGAKFVTCRQDCFQGLCETCHADKTLYENEKGYHFQAAYESCLHPVMYEEMLQPHAATWPFIEYVNPVSFLESPTVDGHRVYRQRITPGQVLCEVDKNRCRENLLNGYHIGPSGQRYAWPVYCPMDYPVLFQGELTAGRYYIHTTCTEPPFKGNGWYFLPEVHEGLACGFIALADIRLQYRPSRTVPHDYFQPMVELLKETFPNDANKVQKLAIVALVGMMRRMSHTRNWHKHSLDKHTAGDWCCLPSHKMTTIKDLADDLQLYEGLFEEEVVDDTTCRMIYDQNVGMEAVEVGRMGRRAGAAFGHEVLRSYKTDAVQVELWPEKVAKFHTLFANDEWAPGVPKFKTADDGGRLANLGIEAHARADRTGVRAVLCDGDPYPLMREAKPRLCRDYEHPPDFASPLPPRVVKLDVDTQSEHKRKVQPQKRPLDAVMVEPITVREHGPVYKEYLGDKWYSHPLQQVQIGTYTQTQLRCITGPIRQVSKQRETSSTQFKNQRLAFVPRYLPPFSLELMTISEHTPATDIIDSGKGLQIVGGAGFGKSTLLDALKAECDKRGLTYLSCGGRRPCPRANHFRRIRASASPAPFSSPPRAA